MDFHPDFMHKDTHVLIGQFFSANKGIVESFAHPFGVHPNTVDAWRRPKPSDVNPTGTGKGNPLDQAERFIKLAHSADPSKAREMAENFLALVNELDRQTGIEKTQATATPSQLLAKSICEHADVAAALLSGEMTEEILRKALVEIRESEVALLQLRGGVEGLLKK